MADSPRLLARITIDPEVCHGKPFRGLRYPGDMVLTLLSAGTSGEEILRTTTTWSGTTSWPFWPLPHA